MYQITPTLLKIYYYGLEINNCGNLKANEYFFFRNHFLLLYKQASVAQNLLHTTQYLCSNSARFTTARLVNSKYIRAHIV